MYTYPYAYHVLLILQNAASFGYFDTVKMDWNRELLQAADFPVDILPKVGHSRV
jgi:hypothetical protein